MRDDNLEICRFKDDHVFCLVHFRRKQKEVDPLATTPDSLRLRTDVIGTGIEKEKDKEEEDKAEVEGKEDEGRRKRQKMRRKRNDPAYLYSLTRGV